MHSKIEIRKLDPDNNDYSQSVARLYRFEGWLGEGEDVSHINRALKNSFCSLGAYDGETMVGFFRSFSDGVSDAYLLDLVVDPQYRGRGIGGMLTQALLKELHSAKLSWITCIANPGVDRLYAKYGKIMDGFTPMRF